MRIAELLERLATRRDGGDAAVVTAGVLTQVEAPGQWELVGTREQDARGTLLRVTGARLLDEPPTSHDGGSGRLGVVLRPGVTLRSDELILRTAPPGAALGAEPIELLVADERRYLDRVRGVPAMDGLAGRRALVLGLGSVGSDVGLKLARLGIDVTGVDPQRLAVENLVRWGSLATMADVGRPKAAVWEAAAAAIPGGRARGLAWDAVRDAERLDDRVREERPDLLIVATDTRDSRAAANALAARHRLPALYVAFADRATSVRIEVVEDAAAGPCHLCSAHAEGTLLGATRGSLQPYAVGEHPAGVPALPANIALGVALVTRIAVALLDGSGWRPWFVHGAQRGRVQFVAMEPEAWVMEEPLQRVVVEPERWPDCPTCGRGEQSDG